MKVCIFIAIFCIVNIVSAESIEGFKTTYEVTKEGSGDRQVVNGDGITLHTTGSLADGTEFWSSKTNNQPFSTNVGAGQLIKGFDAGVVGLRVGEVRKLSIPYEEGYGTQGIQGVIPANSDLFFEVELLKFDNEEKDL